MSNSITNDRMYMKKPKFAIIGTVGLPAKYGGFETLAEHLVDEMSNQFDISVYCSKKKYPKVSRPAKYKGAKLIYLPFDANGLQSIIYDSISILHALFFADVLMILGVSGGFMLPFVKIFTKKKIIISIDGIEWKRKKWSKLAKWYLWAAEWVAVKFSHADISDNESIQDYTAIRYKTLSNIIEYGADHTMQVKAEPEDKQKYPFISMPYAFKVCRIEPENNIHVVLEAFSKLPQHTLVMVGNWKNGEYGIELHKQYQAFSNIILLGPIYNQRELDLLRSNCLVYVHGHSAGGTNPSLVEAMYLGLPVIAYSVTYNKTTTENQAFYFKNADELTTIIANTRLAAYKEKAAILKEIALRRYTWKVIADKYAYLVKKVLTVSSKSKLQPTASLRLTKDSLIQNELGHLQSPLNFYEKI
jgi:glycosyltransferase involved in cell wall biosynthesis